MTRRVNYARAVNNIAQRDRLRAQAIISEAEAVVVGLLGLLGGILGGILGGGGTSSSIENQAVTYVATVGVGSPATNCNYK